MCLDCCAINSLNGVQALRNHFRVDPRPYEQDAALDIPRPERSAEGTQRHHRQPSVFSTSSGPDILGGLIRLAVLCILTGHGGGLLGWFENSRLRVAVASVAVVISPAHRISKELRLLGTELNRW